MPSRRLSLQVGPKYLPISKLLQILYTRRFFGGRQPLCGIGVTSTILLILKPIAFNDRIVESRPGPGPLIITSRFFTPYSLAISPAFSAATCAANGVLLREPLNPEPPAVAQDKAFPLRSVIVIMVLLKEACTCAIPSVDFSFNPFFITARSCHILSS